MAYCKKCGNPIKDENTGCPICGAAVFAEEARETEKGFLEKNSSQTERPHSPRPRWKKFRLPPLYFQNSRYPESTVSNMHSVFDRKNLLATLMTGLAFLLMLAVGIIERGNNPFSSLSNGVIIGLTGILFFVTYATANRGMILMGVAGLALGLLATAVITFCRIGGANGDNGLSCIEGLLKFFLALFVGTMFVEMYFGKRFLYAVVFFLAVISLLDLAHITLSLANSFLSSDIQTSFLSQIISVVAKLLMLFTLLVVYGNLAHLKANDKY